MRRLTLRLLVALFTFTVGVVTASLWLLPRGSHPKVSPVESYPVAAPAEKKRTYESGSHASGIADGYSACWSNFSSSDGKTFFRTSIYYQSPTRAHRELQKYLKKAVEVIKREPIFDEQGRRVGEKVVATFAPYEGSPIASAKLLWADGSDFGYIESSSLSNILEYEKDYKR